MAAIAPAALISHPSQFYCHLIALVNAVQFDNVGISPFSRKSAAELKHHQAIAAQEAGMTCIALSHSVSERFILKKLASLLQKRLDGVKVRVSNKDRDPFEWRKF